MKFVAILFLILFFYNSSYTQENVNFNIFNFWGNFHELRVAKGFIREADELIFYENRYIDALDYYKRAYNINPNNAELNFKIGVSYYNSAEQNKSLDYFKKAYALDNRVDREIYYYLGRAYHLNYDFNKAIEYYNRFAKNTRRSSKAEKVNRLIEQSYNGIEIMKDTLNVNIINLGSNVNTEHREYAPLVTSDGSRIIFTSRRRGTGGRIAEDGMYYEDIYETTRTSDGWSQARGIGRPINTTSHSAAVGLSPDGQQLFVYMDQNGGDIFVSKLQGTRWSRPECIGKNINSPYHESKAAISYDNRTLYFISNRPDKSIGGRDIFYSKLDSNGEWSEPVNLGPTVNTEYDEVDIFLHPDGRTMYFSSEGHNSMGGLDIFRTVRDENGNWSEPENIGYPINTPGDDAFFVTTASGRTAYFASVRPEGFGMHDIYEIQFLVDEEKTEKEQERVYVSLVRGTVRDATTQRPLEARIEIIDNKKDEQIAVFTTNSVSGEYIINLPSGRNYGINVNRQGYLFHSENFNLPDTADYQEYTLDIYLQKMEIGTTVVLRNIFFDHDKETLRRESYSELNRVLEILKNQPELKIEIAGHTDNVGSRDYNYQLSKSRARSVVNYLTERGISEDRLSYEGYAFDKPIADNDTERGRQLNRRVEFKIIEY